MSEAKTVPTADTYKPASYKEAWDNHLAGFYTFNVDQLLLDYTEESELRMFDYGSKTVKVFKGLKEIRAFYSGIAASMPDLAGFTAHYGPEIREASGVGMVFLVWEHTKFGYHNFTDSFTFNSKYKIVFQNVVGTVKAPA